MVETQNFLGHRVEIRRKAFRRSLGVTVYPNGRIAVSVNKTCSWNEIKKFLEERKDWLKGALLEVEKIQKAYPKRKFRSGELYPYLGKDYELQLQKGSKVALRFQNEGILFSLPIDEENMSELDRKRYFQKLKECYRETAKELIAKRVDLYSQKMKLYPKKVSFRGQKSIWGSCSAQNNLSFNWKLIVAPLSVIDYVVVHELSHIKHKDHSSRFWSLVNGTLPNVEKSKEWLKRHHYAADFLMTQSELWSEF